MLRKFLNIGGIFISIHFSSFFYLNYIITKGWSATRIKDNWENIYKFIELLIFFNQPSQLILHSYIMYYGVDSEKFTAVFIS